MIWLGIGIAIGLLVAAVIGLFLFVHVFGDMWGR